MATKQLTKTFTNYATPYKLIVDLTSTATQSSNSSVVKAVISLYCPYGLYVSSRSNTITINGTKYTFTSPAVSTSGGTTHTLGTVTTGAITHNSDGKKNIAISCTYNIQATLSSTYYSSVSLSGTMDLDNIARGATITSAPNFNDEANPTIKYSNPAGNAVSSLEACISFTGKNDDIAYRAISKTGNSYTFELTEAEREVLRQGTKDSLTRTVYFYLRTVMGGQTYSSKIAKTLTIVNCEPSLNGSWVDVSPTTLALTGSETVFIKGESTARATINAEFKKHATLKRYYLSANGNTHDLSTIDITSVIDGMAYLGVEDSRSNIVVAPFNNTVIEYFKPTCDLTVEMPNTNGETELSIKGTFFNQSFGAAFNTAIVEYRYKEEDGEYTDWIITDFTTNNDTYNSSVEISGLNYKLRYTFQARIVDSLNAAFSAEIVARTTPVFDWSKEDFNFNVPVGMNGRQVLRENEGATVLAGNGESIYLRPNGNDNAEGQLRIFPNGIVSIDGWNLPYIATGSASVGYGTSITNTNVDFGVEFASKPVVMIAQVFDDANITLRSNNITTTGFTCSTPAAFTSSGNRAAQWIAIGQLKK